MSTTTSTLACDLTVFSPEERQAHFAAAGDLRDSLTGLLEVGDTTELSFQPGTNATTLREFARQERRCCSWIEDLSVREEEHRTILVLKATPEGRAAWSSAFMGIAQAPVSSGTSGPTWKQVAVAGAALCAACLLPMAGALLVARGLMPAAWNIGEGVYLAAGGAVFAAYYAARWWKKRKSDEAKAGAGCTC